MERKVIATDKAPKAIGPYNQGIKLTGGSLYFISGQLPMNPETGKLVEGDIAQQTKQVMENLGAILAAEGLDFSNVIKATIFLTDLAGDFKTVNEVYGSYFKAEPPARATVQVAALPLGVPVEIEMIAAK